MLAEVGHVALWFAAALAALQLAVGWAGARDGQAATLRFTGTLAVLQAALVGVAFLCLLAVFARTDLSVALVAASSHTAKPWIYKVAGAWGNHEGSMLLWVTVLALSGAVVAVGERLLDAATKAATLAAQGAIALGFYVFLLFASNPFTRLTLPAAEGQGLNPLLQDPGLAFHPPTLYLGYVGLSVAFSFAVGALVTGRVGRDFARAMRPWVLAAWVFLSLGITAGSYWAYYELGWGGWWFWDPVENASLMPWLAATALLHSASVLAARDGLRVWTIMLAVTAFSLSMVGTFLVRSGVLTSVHSFAVDPTRGAVLLVLLALYIGGALTLFALRAHTVAEGTRFGLWSREGALVVNNLLLTGILAVVLVGTLYPLAAEALGTPISVGPPYFDSAGAVFAVPLLIAMAAGPLLRWRRNEPAQLGRRLALPGLVAIIALLAGALAGAGLLPTLGIGLGAGLLVASVLPLVGRRLARTPLPVFGMVIAHAGLAVAVLGMASDSAFSVERLAALPVGGGTTVGPWSVELIAVAPALGPNWTAVEGTLAVARGGTADTLRPQQRAFWTPPTVTSEAAIRTGWDGQLYTVVGGELPDGRWTVRLWWKPFVTLIWLGGALVGLGGAVSTVGRLRDNRRLRLDRLRLEGAHD